MNMEVLTAIWFLSATQFSLYTETTMLRISSARWMEMSLRVNWITWDILSLRLTESSLE